MADYVADWPPPWRQRIFRVALALATITMLSLLVGGFAQGKCR